ncbi:hypothetical protein AGMMS49525_11290 [Bacteroidia bacterium]|nr:hypothetical protein AGMMS49525_11290 [Bacteroidia bacterium]
MFNTIKTELNRNFEVLKAQPIPAYYGFARLSEVQNIGASANLGYLQDKAVLNSPTHILTTSLRVGDYTLDNSHEIRESGDGGLSIEGGYVPYEPNDKVLKTTIWMQLDKLYKESIQTYEQVKANMAVKVKQEDKSPDFSHEAVVNTYQKPIQWADLKIDPKALEEKVKKYSAVFNENSDLQGGSAYFMVSLTRKIFIDTEGRESAENAVSVQLFLTAHTIADDGMYLPLLKSWMGFSLDEMPDDETVIKAARELSVTLSALKKAPVVESFTGPAILSPEAAGVFFHEIFGHRIEGSRLKQETDAQTFKKKIGERVLPKHLSVTFDPTLSHFQKTPLVGAYTFDDEGIPAQRVKVVENGVLRNFLMSRTPIEGQFHSNGHGRAAIGATPMSRQSNLLVESSQRFSDDELLKKLRKEAKSQGKDYAYYFKEVSGGFTTTSRYSPNSFNVTPLVVYRVYVDGRPNELVRGVDMVGTPLAMFAQIEACGETYATFNGVCGAESGSVPVSATAPALFVKHIETQKRAKSQTQPPLLPQPPKSPSGGLGADALSGELVVAETKPSSPDASTSLAEKSTPTSPDASTTPAEKPTPSPPEGDLGGSVAIFRAMQAEVNRGLDSLKMSGLAAPFFISYTIGDLRRLNVVASLGSLIGSDFDEKRTAGTRMLLGDYQCSDENFRGSTGGSATGFDGSPTLENDEMAIRHTIWRDLDAIYKHAAETYEQKIATIKQLNIPAKDLELPDWDKPEPPKSPSGGLGTGALSGEVDVSGGLGVRSFSGGFGADSPFLKGGVGGEASRYEEYAKQVSKVFNDYPEVLEGILSLQLVEATAYFYNTEGTQFRYPIAFVSVQSVVKGHTDEGEKLNAGFEMLFASPNELPSVADMQAKCRESAKKFIELLRAPKLKESYSGPILFEGKAVTSTVYTNFMWGDVSLIAERKPLTSSGFAYGGNDIEEMMNKRITAREISIEDLTGTPEYNGQRLLGYAPIDAEGVEPPAKTVLVENGILKTLLNGRVPTPKVPHSNGHALFTTNLSHETGSGVFRFSDTRTKSQTELKKELLTRAKEEGYDYAYIIRKFDSAPEELYQVSVTDGSEKRVRAVEIKNVNSQIFKKIIAVSDKETIENTLFGRSIVSIIAPEAILFEEMQIQSDGIDNFKKAPTVKRAR